MEKSLLVHEPDCCESLEHDIAHCAVTEIFGAVFHKLIHILVEELEYHLEFIICSYDFFELDDVRMGDFTERFYLSQVYTFFP